MIHRVAMEIGYWHYQETQGFNATMVTLEDPLRESVPLKASDPLSPQSKPLCEAYITSTQLVVCLVL